MLLWEKSAINTRFFYRTLPDATVSVTTDGFSYPNQTLIDQDILNHKGFPESYDMEALLDFLDRLRMGRSGNIPVYSHKCMTSFLERINVSKALILSCRRHQRLSKPSKWAPLHYWFLYLLPSMWMQQLNDGWYLDRFLKLLSFAQNDHNSYYQHKYRLEKLGKPLLTRFGPACPRKSAKLPSNRRVVLRLFSTRLKTMKSMKFT